MQINPLAAGALVPGLPHLLLDRSTNPAYAQLAAAMEFLGDTWAARGVTRILYYSTQWISVLGHSLQARRHLVGHHVDENWHDLVDLPFDFRIDHNFAEAMSAKMIAAGYQARLVDYEGFPVDTATIVADKFLNRGRFVTGMMSCSVYSNYEDTRYWAGMIADALREVDGDQAQKTVLVGVTSLSGRYFTRPIDLREDHISSPEDEQWNRRVIALLEKGAYRELESLLPAYQAACKVDMGLKALAYLRGAGLAVEGRAAHCLAYGALYGTGAAVVNFA